MKGLDRDRGERLLALLLLQSMKSSSAGEKIVSLSIAGFSNLEIADILQVPSATIAQRLYEARKAKGGRKPSKKPKKSRKS